MLAPSDVAALARSGRVQQDPSYHARERNVRFEQIRTLLAFCYKVVKDNRTGDQGKPLHPNGYVCWCADWGRNIWRIDFNLVQGPDRQLILVVTGWPLETERT